MNKNKIRVHNFFVATLENTITGEKKQYRAENIVLDCYFKYLIYDGYSTSSFVQSILVGTGTGTLDPSRTSLFQPLASHDGVTEVEAVLTSANSMRRVLTTTFTETEANGTLTEVALGRRNNLPVTHAFFTDSEQHPISIVKTNTDRLTLEATLYVEWDIDPQLDVMYYPAWASGDRPLMVMTPDDDVDKQTGLTPGGISSDNYVGFGNWISGRTSQLVFRASGGATENIGLSLVTRAIPSAYYPGSPMENKCILTANGTIYYDLSTGLYRVLQGGQINSNTGNLARTYQIRSLQWRNRFVIPFPNHSIYPPKLLTFELTSDGGTDYNLGIPELMTTNVEVSVDGVVQDPSTYTFNGKDFTYKQAWVNSDNKYVKHCDCYQGSRSHTNTSRLVPFTLKSIDVDIDWQSADGGNPAVIYDFGSARGVDTFISEVAGELLYSSDCENWITAATISSATTPATVVTFSEISARYWKCTFPKSCSRYWGDNSNAFTFVSNFDKMTPQLKFNSAPPSGAVIQVKAYTEYPVKNSNWIINQTAFDIIIGRGTPT